MLYKLLYIYMPKYLLIRLQQLQLRQSLSPSATQQSSTSYYAFSLQHPYSEITSKLYPSSNIAPIINASIKKNTNNQASITELTDDIIIELTSSSEQQQQDQNSKQYNLYVMRYQNKMLRFVYQDIDLRKQFSSQLQKGYNHNHNQSNSNNSNKKIVKRKQQIKQNQILTYHLYVLDEEQFRVNNKYNKQILQHYLIISNISITNNANQHKGSNKFQQNYLSLTSNTTSIYSNSSNKQRNTYILNNKQNNANINYNQNISNYVICLKMPTVIDFKIYDNNQNSMNKPLVTCNSNKYHTDQISQQNLQQIKLQGNKNSSVKMKCEWGINLVDTKNVNLLLSQAHQLLIYDMEIKFENYNQYGNCKVKIIYGSKAFELTNSNGNGPQFNTPKAVKIRKFIHFLIKSEDEQIIIAVEKNLKIIAQSRFYTDQLISYQLNMPKRKLIDIHKNKNIGYIKFKCEKSKNLSLPANNKFWKQSNKKKYGNGIGIGNITVLSIAQLSANYIHDQPIQVIIKTDTEQKLVPDIPNFEYYDNTAKIICEPVVITAKNDQSVYLLVKNKGQTSNNNSNNNDFIGITLLNFNDLLMGENPVELSFFKNQSKTVTINCIINKAVSYPFVKSIFQPQLLLSTELKTLTVSLFLKKILLTPYFYTFDYTKKTQIYCIIQVNKLKKVLILEPSIHDELLMQTSASSDSLNFIIQQCEYLKIRVTILLADLGQDQQIYGIAVIKAKVADIMTNSESLYTGKTLNFNKISIKNDYNLDVGKLNLEVFQGAMENSHMKATRDILNSAKHKKQSVSSNNTKNRDIRHIQAQIAKITNNIQTIQRPTEDQYQQQYFSNNNNNTNNNSNNNNNNTNNIHNNANIKHVHQSLETKKIHKSQERKSNNSSLKLPTIRQSVKPHAKKKENFEQLMNLMQVRKRGSRGQYQDALGINKDNKNKTDTRGPSNTISQKRNQRYHTNNVKSHLKNRSMDINNDSELLKIQRQNPNLNRNLQILFPKKGQRRDHIRQQIDQYQEKLMGLKSVLEEISLDIGEIEPTINGDQHNKNDRGKNKSSQNKQSTIHYNNDKESPKYKKSSPQKIDLNSMEWDDNQFAVYN